MLVTEVWQSPGNPCVLCQRMLTAPLGANTDPGANPPVDNDRRSIEEETIVSVPMPAAVPARPESQWPIGIRLRFRMDAELNPQYERLRGKPVLVLSGLRLLGPSPDGRYSWRQQVLALTTGTIGWARPDQLGLPLDGEAPEAF
ncbi:hypothetical protein SAMN04488120_10772 [Fontimonas thermophila]|uniref:Uncharacterized protein n=1 Tax=Fontimonas thermophila TaxID=1076937 RepID=A0A1I2JKS2_9GAMM|nr:hypothetical protein SAMN04488120_10772 [Fontimonas thermophila]